MASGAPGVTDYAAIARAVVPIGAECLDCGESWNNSEMRSKALEHKPGEGHFVCITSRPMTDEERAKT